MAQKTTEERIADARNAAELALLKRVKLEADKNEDLDTLEMVCGAYRLFAEAVEKLDGPLVLTCPCYPDEGCPVADDPEGDATH